MASCQLILRIMAERKVDNTTRLLDMVSLILKQQSNSVGEQAEVQSLLENTMETLCRKGMGKQAENLARQALKQKLALTPSICEKTIKAKPLIIFWSKLKMSRLMSLCRLHA